MHWGISYLREDIQDLRHETRALHARIDHAVEMLGQRIDGASDSMASRMDARFSLLFKAMIALNGLTAGSIIAFLKYSLPAQ